MLGQYYFYSQPIPLLPLISHSVLISEMHGKMDNLQNMHVEEKSYFESMIFSKDQGSNQFTIATSCITSNLLMYSTVDTHTVQL